ncbi:MAG: energy-coupling factor transporter transmembrane component T family protein, partial [Thermodesulfobacteriota bacterium]
LKSHAILLVLIALAATMNSATLGYVLDYFRLPPKLVYLLLLTYRYIFVIEQEYIRLSRAARLRSFHPRTNLHTYRTYAYLVGMLFVRAAARAERVYKAMRCRGFQGKIYCLRSFAVTRLDWIWTGLLGAWMVCLAVLEWAPVPLFS